MSISFIFVAISLQYLWQKFKGINIDDKPSEEHQPTSMY